MLAKILEDMWVEPEVLEALSEEQKRILFLKMREEQVRRWTEREIREEREGGEPSKRPKKGRVTITNYWIDRHTKEETHLSFTLGFLGNVVLRLLNIARPRQEIKAGSFSDVASFAYSKKVSQLIW